MATASAGELDATSRQGATGDSATPEKAKPFIHGYLSTRYRARWSGGVDDHDVDSVLGLEFGDPNKDRVTGHLMARAIADLNGASATDPFFSLEDTYDQRLTTRLYYAWADIRPESPKQAQVEHWRLGRQIDYLTPEFAWFDGVSAQTRPRGKQHLQLGLYGGVPVHLYESSASGDAVLITSGAVRRAISSCAPA